MRFVFSTVCGGGILLPPFPNRYALPFFAGEDAGCIIKRSFNSICRFSISSFFSFSLANIFCNFRISLLLSSNVSESASDCVSNANARWFALRSASSCRSFSYNSASCFFAFTMALFSFLGVLKKCSSICSSSSSSFPFDAEASRNVPFRGAPSS